MSEQDFHFTFHFSNFQYPLSQDTAPWLPVAMSSDKSRVLTANIHFLNDAPPKVNVYKVYGYTVRLAKWSV